MPTNPYLSFNSSLNVTASVLERRVSSPEVRARIQAEGFVWDYEIGTERNNPSLGVAVESDDPQVVIGTIRRVLQEFETQLEELQDRVGAPNQSRISGTVLSAPDTPVGSTGNLPRVLIAVATLGALLAIAAAVLVDALATTSRASATDRERRKEPSGGEDGNHPRSASDLGHEPPPEDPPTSYGSPSVPRTPVEASAAVAAAIVESRRLRGQLPVSQERPGQDPTGPHVADGTGASSSDRVADALIAAGRGDRPRAQVSVPKTSHPSATDRKWPEEPSGGEDGNRRGYASDRAHEPRPEDPPTPHGSPSAPPTPVAARQIPTSQMSPGQIPTGPHPADRMEASSWDRVDGAVTGDH
ncbi:MAG: hypothetical protein KY462_12175 [Actinobacteria bacterium]|nr:hypothetical protein [Actinomycetota bacterium]